MLKRREFLAQTSAWAGATLLAGAGPTWADDAAFELATFRTDVSPPDGHPLCGGWIKPVVGQDDSQEAIGLVLFGGTLFAAGLSIALPVGFAIILVQLVMAMLARSAPQLNLFSVGLPAALLAGIVLLAMAAPMIADGILAVLRQGLGESQLLARG